MRGATTTLLIPNTMAAAAAAAEELKTQVKRKERAFAVYCH